MNPWVDRLALARAGWITEIRLTTHGIASSPAPMRACGVWARTIYWHGWITDVCLHDHAILDITAPDTPERVAGLVANVREACERARR